MPAPDLNRLRRHVFAACREMGLDDETRKDLQKQATGKASSKEMGPADFQKMLAALKAKGWKPKGHKGRSKEPRADQRLIVVYWRIITAAGVMKPGRENLNHFICSGRFNTKYGHAKTDLRFITPGRASDVIEALKDIARRNQIRLDR